ncbi:MAG: FAD-binding oxidoreductase [Candidatus Eremiobacteraeota bacterium]|nr:FAD-binding oxidoreductase [Candidatus Eremiobacteraeota bacterium]
MIAPMRSVAPSTDEEVAQTVRECAESAGSLAVRGGNTLAAMGRPVSSPSIELSTLALNGVIEHEARDLTCAVASGLTLAGLQAALGASGQFVPLDAPLPKTATVGGTLAAGWLGPRRHRYSRARDFVIGTHAVLADGSLVHSGGMVVKNVSGYDMSKLYIGSFGTLGILTRVNFRTLPVPARARAFLAALPAGTRPRIFAHVRALDIPPAAAFLLEGFRRSVDGEDGIDGRAVIYFEGSEALLERATRDLRSALGRAGVPDTHIVDAGARDCFQRVVDATIASVAERSVTYRVIGTVTHPLERAVKMRDLAHAHELFTDVLLDAMNGDVFVRVSDRDTRAFAAKIKAFDGAVHGIEPYATIVSGNAPLRDGLAVWGEPPTSIERMRALKRRFDPERILNPGRFVGGI